MSLLAPDRVRYYLDLLRELGRGAPLTDLHVHATEVIRGRHRYSGDPGDVLRGEGAPPYAAPRTGSLRLSAPGAPAGSSPDLRNRVSEVMFERAYRHTGARPLCDQMDLCGVARALLLPVARRDLPIEAQMDVLARMRGASPRFLVGYSVGSEGPLDAVEGRVADAVARYRIAALKLHPNLSGIDLARPEGRARAEAIVAAAGAAGLPAIVHGGQSPILGASGAARHAAIDQLAGVDWSLTREPVVIAHLGVYGCGASQVGPGDVAALRAMLDRHPHLWLDTSGVGPDVLRALLPRLDLERVVFGSDALYVPIWHALVGLAWALDEMGEPPAERLAQIAGRHPERVLGEPAASVR